MTDQHDHSWAAAILYHLDDQEAETVATFPDDLADIAASAPRETVGPLCLECAASFGDEALRTSNDGE